VASAKMGSSVKSDFLLEVFSSLYSLKHFEEAIELFQLLQGSLLNADWSDVRLHQVMICSLEESMALSISPSSLEDKTYMMISLYQQFLMSPISNPSRLLREY